MTARAIVRDDGVLSGRWHFEGTTIPIAAIVSDHHFGHSELKTQYRFMNLSDDEISAALAFTFPVIRPSLAFVDYASITVSCVCGEDTHKAATGPEVQMIECPCRRTWSIDLAPVLAVDNSGS
jgi:uncharacterized protein (DUF433 family)